MENFSIISYPSQLPKVLHTSGDRFILTTGSLKDSTDYVVGRRVIELHYEMLKSALYYFSLKITQEVKTFLKRRKYVNISEEIDGVLYYGGRIPTTHNLDGYPDLCVAAIAAIAATFCVPVVDQYSQVAICIAMEIHWQHHDVKHTGIETMLSQTLSAAHIIGGRHLAKSVKRICKRCRIINKKTIDVIMGPIQNVNQCI